MILQGAAPIPTSTVDLIGIASPETKVVLAITALFSVVSWFLIGYKWWQFRRAAQGGARFLAELDRTATLQEGYRVASRQMTSPHARLLASAMRFCAEVGGRSAGSAASVAPPGPATLTLTQLEALRLVLGREIAAEREMMGRFLPWLATIGATSPLLGLLGTVLGVISSFIGIATSGSGSIAAVAPGIAEALVATVAGIGAAIPAVMAYNLFTSRLRRFGGELEGFASELIASLAREGYL